ESSAGSRERIAAGNPRFDNSLAVRWCPASLSDLGPETFSRSLFRGGQFGLQRWCQGGTFSQRLPWSGQFQGFDGQLLCKLLCKSLTPPPQTCLVETVPVRPTSGFP